MSTTRATKRPFEFEKPKHWTNDPAPKPEAAAKDKHDPQDLSPTRYGDWIKDGIAIDF